MESTSVDPGLLASANWWFDVSWYGLLFAGVVTALAAVATVAFLFLQFWSGGVRERHSEWRTSVLELQTEEAKRDAAEANKIAEGERLARIKLESVVQPRRLWSINLRRFPRIIELSPELKDFSGTPIKVQVVPDFEAQTLANDLVIVLQGIGWKPEFIGEAESKVPPMEIPEGISVFSPLNAELNSTLLALSKATTKLADALTKVGMLPITINPVPLPPYGLRPTSIRSTPKIDGDATAVYVQIGMKPVVQQLQSSEPTPSAAP